MSGYEPRRGEVPRGDGDLIRSLEDGLCCLCMKPVGVPWVQCIGFPEHPECHERECA
jgi:hypothetical protein